MKRLHVNLAVADIEATTRFYTSLFGVEPTVRKEDYAKWMLEDPRVNFAVTTRPARKGVDHLGVQVEDDHELGAVTAGLKAAGASLIEQGETSCCYARSEKNWVMDPDGVAWETFLTHGDSPVYGEDTLAVQDGEACCIPAQARETGGCGVHGKDGQAGCGCA